MAKSLGNPKFKHLKLVKDLETESEEPFVIFSAKRKKGKVYFDGCMSFAHFDITPRAIRTYF